MFVFDFARRIHTTKIIACQGFSEIVSEAITRSRVLAEVTAGANNPNADARVRLPHHKMARLRKCVYHQYIIWRYGHLGPSNRKLVLSGVTWLINDMFSDANVDYIGYFDH